jgi:hypothetical protein
MVLIPSCVVIVAMFRMPVVIAAADFHYFVVVESKTGSGHYPAIMQLRGSSVKPRVAHDDAGHATGKHQAAANPRQRTKGLAAYGCRRCEQKPVRLTTSWKLSMVIHYHDALRGSRNGVQVQLGSANSVD